MNAELIREQDTKSAACDHYCTCRDRSLGSSDAGHLLPFYYEPANPCCLHYLGSAKSGSKGQGMHQPRRVHLAIFGEVKRRDGFRGEVGFQLASFVRVQPLGGETPLLLPRVLSREDNGPLLLSYCRQIRPALYSPLLRIPVMASSKGSIWPLTHAASNASSPSAPRAAATVRSCSARLAGGSGQPLSSRSAAAVPQSRAARSILPCATATWASPSKQSRMVCLRPIRRPPSSRLSSYNLDARAYSPASHATFPRLASVRAMPHACSLPRDKARLSSSSILARLRFPCPRTASAKARMLQAILNALPKSRARVRDCSCRRTARS